MRSTKHMKIKDVLRLYEDGIYSYAQIAQHAGIGRTTVWEIIKRCSENGIDYKKSCEMSGEELEKVIFPTAPGLFLSIGNVIICQRKSNTPY